MIQKKLVIGCILPLCMLAINAIAQNPKDDVFYRETRSDVTANYLSAGNTTLHAYGGAEFLFGDVSPGLSHEDMRCPTGTDCADNFYGSDPEYSNLNLKDIRTRGAERKFYLNTYSAPTAVVGTLNSGAHKTMIDGALASLIATQLSAIELVEPAIARGLESSLGFSNDTVNLEYESDTNFHVRADTNKETAEILRQSRSDCIGQMLELNPAMVWIEAKMLCDGDAKDGVTNVVVGPAIFDSNSEFNLGDNTNHDNYSGNVPGVGPIIEREKYESMWAYLLRQDSNGGAVTEFAIGGGSNIADNNSTIIPEEVLALRRLVGDVLFRLDRDSLVSSSSTRIVSTTVLPPHLDVSGDLTPTTQLRYAGPKWYIQQLEGDLYDKIWELLRDFCNYNNTAGSGSNPYESMDLGGGANADFWRQAATDQKLRSISSPNITFTAALGELLMYFVSLEDPAFLAGLQTNTVTGYDCSRVDPSAANIDRSNIYLNAGLDTDLLSLRIRVIQTLANRLATDNVWAMLGKATSRLERLSGGTYDTSIKMWGNKLIQRVAQTDYMRRNGAEENYNRMSALVKLLGDIRAADNVGDLFGILASMREDRDGGGMRSGFGNTAS